MARISAAPRPLASPDSPAAASADAPGPLRIGVSACLLGEEVRYDGGHKLDHFLTDTLARFVEFVQVCPEVGVGLGTPRESLRLVQVGGRTHLVGRSGADQTEPMERWAARKVRELEKLDLSGYVLKKDSPSCGMERVRLYDPGTGIPSRGGVGLFAAALLQAMPLLPVEEEGRLRDWRLRENFIERVFGYRRLRALLSGRWTVGQLVAFHSRAKLQVLAHDPAAYTAMGRLVAGAKALDRAEVAERYAALYTAALAKVPTVKRHVNVLQHIAGYFKKQLDEAGKAELHGAIADYQHGLAPLIVPVTLIRHHVRVFDVDYLRGQLFLEPSPKELMLRNHV